MINIRTLKRPPKHSPLKQATKEKEMENLLRTTQQIRTRAKVLTLYDQNLAHLWPLQQIPRYQDISSLDS